MMGQDGNTAIATNKNKHIAKDAFGYSLSYFADDYKSANEDFLNHSHGANPNLPADHFNGNIGSMFTALTDEDENPIGTHQTKYTYDQLNRIKSMTGFDRTVGQTASTSGYSSSYSFDANGNLETLKRNAWDGTTSVLMDDFEYHYNETINGGNNNRLSGLTDHAGSSQFSDKDIDNSITASNYDYDEIGQLISDDDEGILDIKWKVTNKVEEIVYTDGKVINFDYDAMGNRIAKHVTEGGGTESTYYFLDAKGNQMTIYEEENFNDEEGYPHKNLYLSERNIFGSSRIGQEKVGEIIASTDVNLVDINTETQKIIGDKRFHMRNLVENNLLSLSDRKIPEPDGQGGIDYFLADTKHYSEFFPYGMVMRDGGESQRYSFQNQEQDSEVKGENNSINYKYRMHDPRVGRFFAVDPLASKYPHNSPYAFSENRVIDMVELEGLEMFDPNQLIEAGKAYLYAITMDYVSSEVTKRLNNLSHNVESKIDEKASDRLIIYSQKIVPEVADLNEEDKAEIFKADAEKTKAILLYEFAAGVGPEQRDFSFDDPITKDVATGYVIKDLKNKLAEITKEDFNSNDGTRVSISFSPTSSMGTWGKSAYRHMVSTGSQFFIGGAIATIKPTANDEIVNVTITNVTSRNSLMLHLVDNKTEGKLANKTQTFSFGLKVNDDSFKSEDE